MQVAHSTDTQARAASRRFYSELLGSSGQMREVRELIDRVADTDVTVLIRGESGTGKELVARAVHEASPRRERPFVKVNCAALPTELLESELFGFERGAFTGAIQQKPGKFEFANHGTMFLDEISEMGPALQSKLLQVLQDGGFARLGGRQDVKVDVRVVTATNRDLESAVAEGQFREDLYFRLNVVCITLPPLRQRRDEIRRLTDFFLAHYSQHYNKPPMAMATDTLRLFAEYDWPGNVRELENLLKRMVILGTDTAIRRELADAITHRGMRVGTIPVIEQAAHAAAAPVAAPPPGPVAHGGHDDAARSVRVAERHRPHRGARGGTGADLSHPPADAVEQARGRRDPGDQLQGPALQDQGSGARQSIVSDVLNPETFDFVLTNELKRAARSQNFVTLVLMEPRSADSAEAVREIAGVVSHELRETDLLATDDTAVWMVLLDTDVLNSSRVINRVTGRLEHYQFTAPVNIEVGAACCPTDGADVATLRRVASEARTALRRPTHMVPPTLNRGCFL